MADMRNNDWTDALRERLSSSELTPSSDVWSKVERAAADASGVSRTLKKPFLWVMGCVAAAALVAVIILPGGGREPSLQIAPQSQDVPLTVAQVPSLPSPVAPSPVVPSPAAPLAPSPAALVPENASADALAESTEFPVEDVEPDSQTASEDIPAADRFNATDSRRSESLSRRPAEDLFLTGIQEEAPKRKKSLTASLFAAGIPGNETNGMYEFYTLSGTRYMYFNGGISIASGLGMVTDPIEISSTVLEKIRKDVRHHRPVSFGITISYPLTDRWFLETGLVYSYLRSEYDLPSEFIIHPDYAVRTRDQKLHFLGVPAKIGYRLTASPHFSLSLSAGAMAERCVYGEWLGNKVEMDGSQFSAVASAAVQYKMGDRLSLFLSPEWSYYFTETVLPSFRTETPASFTLRLGLNLDLGQ